MADYITLLRRMQGHKRRNALLVESYTRLGQYKLAQRARSCASYVGIGGTDEEAVIVEAKFCQLRLCPTCTWRRSLKIYGATSKILCYVDKMYPNVKYLFLTLTIKNIPLPDLGDAIDGMSAAYNRLRNNRAFKRRVKGAMRTLEVTVNKKTRMAHPHYHLILAVDKSYATKKDDTYWTHDDWVHAWRQAARLDYDPSVYIERVKGRRTGIAEMAKYTLKDADYLMQADEDLTDYLVHELTAQLRGRRLISYTGILRDAQKALKIDPEQGADVDELRGDISDAIRRYHWSAGLGKYVSSDDVLGGGQ